MSSELDTAIRAVREAGRLLLSRDADRNLQHKDVHGDVADSRKQFVTEMDVRCEQEIKQILRAAFPTHGFLTEEADPERVNTARVWVVDALDGTLSYSHGLPSYTTAISLLVNCESVLGAVFDPERNELFAAEKGSGAYLNGQRLRVSQERCIENSVVSVGHRILRIDDFPRAKCDLVKRVRRIRVSESCSQELCYVAAGRIDAALRTMQPTYDYAMGKIIVEEAAGVAGTFTGTPIAIQPNCERNTNIVAGNRHLVERLLPFLQ